MLWKSMMRNLLLAVAQSAVVVMFLAHATGTSHADTPGARAIQVQPAEFHLDGARARQQLLVSGEVAAPGGTLWADVTQGATYESLSPTIALVTATGLVVPRGRGRAEIVVRYGDLETRAKVTTSGVGVRDAVDFDTEVIAALSRAGCSQGACHGSPQGKSGFRLSLRGFDPEIDFLSLTRESGGRRTNRFAPERSLILQKPLGELSHRGGVRFRKTDPAYQTLLAWISQGCPRSETPPALTRLQVLPADRRVPVDYPRQQLVALAHFADGTMRDVTHLSVFTTSNDEAATVSEEGLVEFRHTAEVTFLVRYLGQITGARLTYVRNDPHFKFVAPAPANYVDEHVFAKQRALQLRPAMVADDAVFLRRVYLDVIGTLPTVDEARRFLDSDDPQKRSKLIDELLNRDEFAYFWALKWADVMRGSKVTISKRGVHSFHRYLVKAFREDRPMDRFARETLTGLGNTLYHPAANFHRIARTPEDAAEAMAQLFLGVRIGCAKCHNHPFESITQDDYYGLAAFFSRVKFKGKQFGLDDEVVYLDQRSEVRHPGTNQNVAPVAFGFDPGELEPEDDRRRPLARWLTSPENPYFARSIVNRLWYHLFGLGIVDPVDDFRRTNPASSPELLDALAADFVEQGFRIKPVLRVILNSHTYQLGADAPEQSPQAADPTRYFTHAVVGMHTGEQILDAISTSTGVPQEFPGYPLGTRAIELAEGDVDHPFLKSFSKPVRDVTCECARDSDPSMSQVIHLLNNPQIIRAIRSPEGLVARLLASEKDDGQVIERLYLSTLSRRPSEKERELMLKHLAGSEDRAAGFFDLHHALINSNEFLLRH